MTRNKKRQLFLRWFVEDKGTIEMQIVNVTSKNIKGLVYAQIAPKKVATVIGGPNASGKSSLLDSIAYALGGKTLCPDKPIREGQDSAEVSVELTGEPARMLPPCVVRRRFFKKKNGMQDSELEIVTKDGFTAPSPQAILNDICGSLGFDPEAFLRMKPKEQAEILRKLVGLDFSALDLEYAEVYKTRTGVNDQGKRLKAQVESMRPNIDVPEEEVSVVDLMAELKKRQEHNRKNQAEKDKLKQIEVNGIKTLQAISTQEEEVKALEAKLQQAQKTLENYKSMAEEAKRSFNDQTAVVQSLIELDAGEVETQIANSQATNQKVRENKKRVELTGELNAKRAESEKLTARLKEIEATKDKMRQSAQWPVEGLGYDENGVTFNGLPFNQASSKEQREVAFGITAALSPTLKFAFIKDGSLLDDEGLLSFAEIAAKHGFQLFVERVGEGSECNIVIRQGEVVRQDDDTIPPADATDIDAAKEKVDAQP